MWRGPGECKQDIMAEGRAEDLLSALGEPLLSPVQGPWGATQGCSVTNDPLLFIWLLPQMCLGVLYTPLRLFGAHS